MAHNVGDGLLDDPINLGCDVGLLDLRAVQLDLTANPVVTTELLDELTESVTEAERMQAAFESIETPNNLTTVPDCEDALDLLRMNARFSEALRPDVVVLDLNLLSTGRHEVLEELKSHHALRCIPVVVLTRPGRASDMKRAYDLAVTHFVTMPDDPDDYARVAEIVADLVTYARQQRPTTS